MNLSKTTRIVKSDDVFVAWGHLMLRVLAGLMIFNIHGWHKMEGWIACLQHGTLSGAVLQNLMAVSRGVDKLLWRVEAHPGAREQSCQ